MTVKEANKNAIKKYGLFILTSFLFMLFFADSTSPLSRYYQGSDTALFMLIGKGIKYGYLPYLDLFDHKGPFLFFITYISQLLIEGKTGLFLIEVLVLFSDLVLIDLIYSLAGLKDDIKSRIIIQIPILLFLSGTIEGGGTCEEFVLPLLLYVLYKVLYFIKSGKDSFNYKTAFEIGISFGLIAMVRINSAIFLCTCCLFVVIYLLGKKQISNIMIISLMCLLGTIVAIVPFIIWYYLKGALYEMIYSTFIFAYEYAIAGANGGGISNLFSKANLPYISFLVLLLLISSTTIKKNTSLVFLNLLTCFTTLVNLFLGMGFLHYLELIVPNLVLSIYIIISDGEVAKTIKNRFIILLLVIIFIGQSWQTTYNFASTIIHFLDYNLTYKWSGYYHDFENQSIELSNVIPHEERDEVWAYGVGSKFYLRTDLYPCIKYFDYVSLYDSSDMCNVKTDIIKTFETDPPKWIFIPAFERETPQYIDEILENQYNLYDCNDFLLLYKFNGNGRITQ